MSTWQYEYTNGHPNRYFGWGWEDHDGAERFRGYNSSLDILLPKNRQRSVDFMNELLSDGFTEDGGGYGMGRADKYGFYTQLRHSHGFTSGGGSMRFLKNTPLEQQHKYTREGCRYLLRKLDGLNSLFYELKNVDYSEGAARAVFEIRPFVLKKVKFLVDHVVIYEHEIGTRKCDFRPIRKVDIRDDVEKSRDSAAQRKRKMDACNEGNLKGFQCNAFTQRSSWIDLVAIPFPL